MSRVEVLAPGARTSLELPWGAHGRAHEGVSRGGASDPLAAVVANRAAGAPDDAGVLEVVLAGPRLRFHYAATIAIAGAPFVVRIDDVTVPVPSGARAVSAGQTLTIASCARGVRCALAVRGGWRGAPGTVVTKGAILEVGDARSRGLGRTAGRAWELPEGDVVLRVTDAPQRAALDDEEHARLLSMSWRVDPASDRGGVRLRPSSGSGLHVARTEMITQGVSVGAVQLLPSGEPVILGVDRATTGGYPVVAHVARVDLWLLGQLRPGAAVRFAWVSFEEARELWRTCPR